MAHSYSNLYRLPPAGLRFFNGIRPRGQRDMAFLLITKYILEEKSFDSLSY